MKKIFSFHRPGRADARVLDAIKHDVRKYVKRERKKPLPEGAAGWDFECRAGADPASAQPISLKDISALIDQIAASGADSVYLEILRVPAPPRGE